MAHRVFTFHKAALFCCVLTFAAVQHVDAGWSMHAQQNYLRESIRILPILDYEMCLHYREPLFTGIVEGEIQFKYRTEGRHPSWMGTMSPEEIAWLNGVTVDESNLEQAATLYAGRLAALRSEISALNRPYGDILFELGYYLAGINNVLLPIYETGHFPEQRLSSNTGSLALDPKKVEIVRDIEPWMKKVFKMKVELRDHWSRAAEEGDLQKFEKLAGEANALNIVIQSSIISFVLDNSYGPADPEHRAQVAKHHEAHLEIVKDRKPWPQ